MSASRSRHGSTRRVAVVATLLAALGCGGHEHTPDDTLVVVIESPMKSADPRFAPTAYDQKLSKLVATGLTAVDTPTSEPRLELAARIDRVDDLTWDVTLRDDARFADGTPVLGSDVAWTYGSVLDEKSQSGSHRGFTERFASVTATGPRVVRFVLKKPVATLMSDFDFGILAQHGAGPDGRYAGNHVLGAGPYVLDELDAVHAALHANPYYWAGVAKVPKVDVKFVRDAAARIVMLVGGSADLVQNAVRPDLVDDVQRQGAIAIDHAPSVILTYMLLNNTDPALRDVRVRQAIALAIDRAGIVRSRFSGRAVLATGLLATSHWAYNPDVPRWDYDPARAMALLDAAGYPAHADGSPRLRLTYKTSSDAFRVAFAREIASNLAAVGIAVEVRPFEFGTFLADVKRGQYQLASMQGTDLAEPDYYYAYFHSSRIPSEKNRDGNNRFWYRNADVDRLTEAGRAEMDRDKRKAIYAEVQRIVAGDVPFVPLFHEDNVVLSRARVSGYHIVPNARLGGLADVTKAAAN